MKFQPITTFLMLLFSLLTNVLSANEDHEEQVFQQYPDCVSAGEWRVGVALGIGNISNPLIDSDDVLLPIVPRISYYGERFFLNNMQIGYTLVDSSNFKLFLSGNLNSDFLFFPTASKAFKGFGWVQQVTGVRPNNGRPDIYYNFGDFNLKDRHASYLVGPELQWRFNNLTLSTKYQKDASKIHYGSETQLELSYRKYWHDWHLEQRVGIIHKSERLNNYYYGVTLEETPDDVGAQFLYFTHHANSTNVPYFALNASKPLNQQWTLVTSLKAEFFGADITDSPIVEDSHSFSGFIGWGYDF